MILSTVGCAPVSRLRLEQPRLATLEGRLDLSSEQVFWSQSDDVCRVLAELPLPGAETGRPTYVLYLRVRCGRPVGMTEVRGFLIQTRGARRGLTPVVAASVKGEPPGSADRWMLDIRLTCEDGSMVSGTLAARREDWRMHRFESRSHAADVNALLAAEPAVME